MEEALLVRPRASLMAFASTWTATAALVDGAVWLGPRTVEISQRFSPSSLDHLKQYALLFLSRFSRGACSRADCRSESVRVRLMSMSANYLCRRMTCCAPPQVCLLYLIIILTWGSVYRVFSAAIGGYIWSCVWILAFNKWLCCCSNDKFRAVDRYISSSCHARDRWCIDRRH